MRVFLACRLTGETSWNFPEVAEAAKPSSAMSPSSMIASDPGEFAPAADMPHSSAVLAPSNYGSGGGRRVSGGGLSLTLGEGVLPRVLIILFCSLVTLISSSVEANQIDKIRAAKEAAAAEATPDGTTTAGAGTTLPPAGIVNSVNVGAGVSGAVLDGAAESFGIAVGAISLSFSLMLLGFAKRKPGAFANWTLPKVKGDLSIMQLYSLFMVVWWAAGAAVLTFFSPFTATCNAYFAIWAAFVCSLLMLGGSFNRVANVFKSASRIREDANVKSLVGLCLSSAVVVFSCIEFVGLGIGEANFGLIAGIVSSLFAALMYYLVDRNKATPPIKKASGALFVLLWLIACVVLTFDGPFQGTGNGYFGTWFATFCAFSFAYQEFVGGQIPLTSSIRNSFSFKPMTEAGGVSHLTPGGLSSHASDIQQSANVA